MYNDEIYKKLQEGFKKGKLKGMPGISPDRLSLEFEKPSALESAAGMQIYTARIKLDGKQWCSFGFGKVPHKLYSLMFTAAPNPQGYDLSMINAKIKALKVQASLSAGQLLLLTRLPNEKAFFDDINKLLHAAQIIKK